MAYGLEFSRNGKDWMRVPENLRCASRRYLERHSRRAIECEADAAVEQWKTPHVRIIDLDPVESASLLSAAQALVDRIEDNPALFFGMEDTCQDEFNDLRSAISKATSRQPEGER